jgi:transposase
MTLYAGLDWASAEHAVCVIDERGTVVERLTIEHTAEGLTGLRRALERLAAGNPIPIAIERPNGLVVDTLIEGGQPVIPIHPNVVQASRPRYGSAGSKSDRSDAYMLADLLRTDGHRFRPLQPSSDEMKALKSKSRTRDDFVATKVQLGNQLRCLLESFWPGPTVMFPEIDTLVCLDFLERYPAPRDAVRLGEKRMATFLAAHSYRGRTTAAEFLERMRAAPTGLAGEAEEEAKRVQVLALVAVLRPLVNQIGKLTAAIEHDVEQLQVGRMMMSFPRAGRLNAGQIVAELGDRTRFATAEHLAIEAGVAPVTRASGKHHAVGFRYACNQRLRNAITCWANNSRHSSEWAADVYRRARARGCDHAHAIRILARAWCRVLWAVWHKDAEYDPHKHCAAVAITQRPAAMPS